MKTTNLLLITGLGLIAYVLWEKSKNKKTQLNSETVSVPASTNLTITPIKANSPTYARNGIYLGYPVIMKP